MSTEKLRPLSAVKVQALRDLVQLEPVYPKRSDGGLILPPPKPGYVSMRRGRVLSVGEGGYDKEGVWRDMEVAVGDIVHYDPRQENQVTEGDKVVLRFVRLEDIKVIDGAYAADPASEYDPRDG